MLQRIFSNKIAKFSWIHMNGRMYTQAIMTDHTQPYSNYGWKMLPEDFLGFLVQPHRSCTA